MTSKIPVLEKSRHYDSEENDETNKENEDYSQSLEPFLSMNSTQLFQDQRSSIIRDAWNMNETDFLIEDDHPVKLTGKSKIPLGQGNQKKILYNKF